MLGRIRGVLAEKTPPLVLIDVSGIGYEIQMPMTSLYQLPDVGNEATVYTHFVVREDAQLLFGFANKQERALFREVIKANGVGPKLALTILSGMSADQFAQAVADGDMSALIKLPGVGKKTAERLLVEMKDRLAAWQPSHQPGTTTVTQVQSDPVMAQPASAQAEAISALIALGYQQVQATKVVKAVLRQGASSEQLIRDALRSIA